MHKHIDCMYRLQTPAVARFETLSSAVPGGMNLSRSSKQAYRPVAADREISLLRMYWLDTFKPPNKQRGYP